MPTIRGSDKGSKKRYAGLKVSSNKTQTLVFKGLESVRTDWTPLARQFQQQLYQTIFNDEPYESLIRETVQAIRDGNQDSQLVFRKRIRRRLNDYKKNVPPHVKAARLADEAREKEGKAARYHRGGWIRYYLTVNGPEPEEYLRSPIDYDLYIERQIKPIADGILHFLGNRFESIIDQQISLL